jgi:hypothetical protein
MTTTTAPPGSRQAHREASERDKRARRFLLRLSLANWVIAVVAWTISAFLGITSPASIIVYSVLFVIGLIAVVVALLTYLLEKFAHIPPEPEHADLEADGDAGAGDTVVVATAADEGGTGTAAKGDPAAAAKGESANAKGDAGPEGGSSKAAAESRAEAPADGKAAVPNADPAADGKTTAPASDRHAAAPEGGSGAEGDSKGDVPAAPAG